jgi:CheY-like chemotaxis protein
MKKVLLVGFTHIQIELARKFLKYRNLSSAIELLPEQQSSVPVDAYVVNGDDASVASRIALYTRLHPRPVLGTGSRAVLGVTVYMAGPFKPATADRLAQMLTGEAPAAAPATAGNVVSFPGATAVVPAEVLVVDDSDMVRRTMTRKINEYGHRVDVASSGDDAMAMLLNNRYRLVFLDVMMPGMDGFEACRRIKRSAEYKSSAVYMLTSKDGMFDKVRGSMAGCDGYLVKPLESRKLREVLDKYFERTGLMGDSDIMSTNMSSGAFNAAELQAIEGSPPPELVSKADLLPPRPEQDFKTTFSPTVPARLDDMLFRK